MKKYLLLLPLLATGVIAANINMDAWQYGVATPKLDRYRDWIDNGIQPKLVNETNEVVAVYDPWITVDFYTNSIQGGVLLGTEILETSNSVDYVTGRTNYPVTRVEDPDHVPHNDANRVKKLNWKIQIDAREYIRRQEAQYHRQVLVDAANSTADSDGTIEE